MNVTRIPPDRPDLSSIFAARQRLLGVATRTPLLPATTLGARLGHPLWLKLESMQPIGAFKLRGAWNAISQLPAETSGVCCCSTGNHGRAVAWSAQRRGLPATVCLSRLVPEAKTSAIAALEAEIRRVGDSQDDAQLEVERLVAEHGLIEIPPFDHPEVIAGQGTIGLEIFEQQPAIDTLLIPLSGGGLAAGIAIAARAIRPTVHLIGVSMDRGAAMAESIDAGHPVDVTEVASLADSLGGGIGLQNRWSFELCRQLLDEVVTVSESSIRDAMRYLFFEERLVAEGGATVGIAALLSGAIAPTPGRSMATIVSGRNVDMQQFHNIINGTELQLGDLILPALNHGVPYT